MTPVVSIIIPVFNQWRFTEGCLRSLAKHSPGNIEILVVDNASTDETAQFCQALGTALFQSRFRCLRQDRNLNFGPASNLGATLAHGEHLFFLNNDTEVRADWLPPLLKTLQSPRIGAVGPRLLYPNGRVQHVGIAFTPQMAHEHLFEHFPGQHPAVLRKRRCQALTAAALLVPRELFLNLEGFFPEFRNGGEDTDLCARIRARELQLAVCPESVIIHHTSQTAGRFDHDDANAALLQSRQAGKFAPDTHLFARQAGYELRLTPWLMPFMARPEPIIESDMRSLEGVRDALNQEPLWEEGYERLASLALRKKDFPLALETRFLQSQFFPSLTSYRHLQGLAARLGHADLAADVSGKIANIAALMSEPQKLLATASRLVEHFRATRQPELQAIYSAWLARTSSPGGSR